MRHIALLFFIACMAPCARAQTVQKCVARDGLVRYQSDPCAPGARTAGTWDAVPDPVRSPPAAAAHARPPAARPRGRSRHFDARQRATEPDACEQARAYRDDAERRAGLARNYELLSTLQRRVYDACR